MTERFSREGSRPRFIEGEILLIPFKNFDVKAAVATSANEIKHLKSRINRIGSEDGFKDNLLPNGRLIVLSGDQVDRYPFDNPHRTESNDKTDAIYLYRYQGLEQELLVQYLGPKTNSDQQGSMVKESEMFATSFHGGHGPEFFGVLEGTLYISNGAEASRLTKGQFTNLPENEPHICYTLGDIAVTAILKTGNLSHNWLPKPDSLELIRQAKLLDKV